MHKKRIALLMASLLLTIACLSGCGESEGRVEVKEPEIIAVGESTPAGPEETEAPPTEEVPEELTTAYPVVREERESVNGQIQSYLTGQWTDETIATRRPIAVMIPNNKPAMPQYGLSKAAIIYEAPVEGRITRLMAVFEDFDDLDRIGPVRSSRDYFSSYR